MCCMPRLPSPLVSPRHTSEIAQVRPYRGCILGMSFRRNRCTKFHPSCMWSIPTVPQFELLRCGRRRTGVQTERLFFLCTVLAKPVGAHEGKPAGSVRLDPPDSASRESTCTRRILGKRQETPTLTKKLIHSVTTYITSSLNVSKSGNLAPHRSQYAWWGQKKTTSALPHQHLPRSEKLRHCSNSIRWPPPLTSTHTSPQTLLFLADEGEVAVSSHASAFHLQSELTTSAWSTMKHCKTQEKVAKQEDGH